MTLQLDDRRKAAANNTYPKGGNFSFFWIVCNYFIVLHIITISAGVPALCVAAERYASPYDDRQC